ncbi:unnamed protein product [marine sediment metagenome]|uniref:Uncharacterized protein n=1 Tax=marine sediment metagenome TaxID=412755 RepID=X1M8B3_9ZZZZ
MINIIGKVLFYIEGVKYAKNPILILWDHFNNLWGTFVLWLLHNRSLMAQDSDPYYRSLKFSYQSGQEEITDTGISCISYQACRDDNFQLIRKSIPAAIKGNPEIRKASILLCPASKYAK